MSEPYIGEIRLFAQGFVPKGWALCNGALLPINQNQALFSILGTMYGGNGVTNFALPNLIGRAPVHPNITGGGTIVLGEMGGAEAHTLTAAEMPAHTHTVRASSQPATISSPKNTVWAARENSYGPMTDQIPEHTMSGNALTQTGGGQAHFNMQPYLVLNFCIAIQGIFPSRE
ncbi:phage tail protein [Brevibacillus sp. GCM10020057]|uniref:phage tail protein n=1 Tax=Brevibacillus sp. GCM10020057 TaxID=3317327 RepID=UPI00362BEB84